MQWAIVSAAAGLAAGAATDLLLAAAGAGQVGGPQAGVVAAPLLMLALSRSARRTLAANARPALVAFGAAWTLAPLIDQHVTQVVVIDGTLADAVHHFAGWAALIAGARLFSRPDPTFTW